MKNTNLADSLADSLANNRFANYIETSNNLNLEMVAVQGGTFMMGCLSSHLSDVSTRPIHRVRLNSYYIGKYEVTQAQWRAIMGSNPSHFKGDNLPVEQVSWNDVQEFIHRLNTQTDKQYRLPTEAEWEYAARGGNNSKGCMRAKDNSNGKVCDDICILFSGSRISNDVAWLGGNSDNKTHPIGTKLPNELGIYDMSGNVWEWCDDCYSSYSGDWSDSRRIVRGGSWLCSVYYAFVFSRYSYMPDIRTDNMGFRLACNF